MDRVLVVEDEPAIRLLLRTTLAGAGFEVAEADSGREASAHLEAVNVDAVLLDLMLPDMDGTEVLRGIRRRGDLPVILLTARGEEMDRILGLEMGADDYIVKPFSPREVVARIKAVLRRRAVQGLVRRARDLEIDPVRHEVRRGNELVALTPKEFTLLWALVAEEGRVVDRHRLLEILWDGTQFGDLRVVDVHVRHVRLKLGDDPSRPQYIETVRGVGYRFRFGPA